MADITLATFTGTAGTALHEYVGETGAAFSQHPSFTGSAVLTAAGAVRPNQTGVTMFYASGVPAVSDVSIEGVLKRLSAPGTQYIAISLRQSVSDFTGCYIYNNNGTWYLQTVLAGVSSQQVTYVAAFANNDRYRIAVTGNVFSGWINNIRRFQFTDATVSADGRAGLLFSGNVGDIDGQHLDSMLYQPLAEVNVLVIDGDSQPEGLLTTPNFAMAHAMQAGTTDTIETFNVAVGGDTIADRSAAYATDVAAKFRADADRNILATFFGTNSVYFYALDGLTSEQIVTAVIADIEEYAALVAADPNEPKWVDGLIPHRAWAGGGGFDPDPFDLNPTIDLINAWKVANWQTYCDRLAENEVDADTSDGVHLTATSAGEAGVVYAAEINDLTVVQAPPSRSLLARRSFRPATGPLNTSSRHMLKIQSFRPAR